MMTIMSHCNVQRRSLSLANMCYWHEVQNPSIGGNRLIVDSGRLANQICLVASD